MAYVIVNIVYNNIYEKYHYILCRGKILVWFFIMLLNGLINVTKFTIYIIRNLKLTFKLNVAKYIPLEKKIKL